MLDAGWQMPGAYPMRVLDVGWGMQKGDLGCGMRGARRRMRSKPQMPPGYFSPPSPRRSQLNSSNSIIWNVQVDCD